VTPAAALDALTDSLAELISDEAPGSPHQAADVIDDAMRRLHALRSDAVTQARRRFDEAMASSAALLARTARTVPGGR
jgi:F0F1-type ATP synthase membrane subunit b/b'